MKTVFSTLIILGAVLISKPAAALPCAVDAASITRTANAEDIQALRDLVQQSQTCSGEYRDKLGRYIAGKLYNRAVQNDPPNGALLEASLEFGRTWEALATLGDDAFSKRRYVVAASRYQEALLEINDTVRTPSEPAPSVIVAIHKKAEESSLLANSYVQTLRGRGGENAGLAASHVRSVKLTSVAFPVEFEFKSTRFTPKGAAAAEDMAKILKNESTPQATLVGHTDPRGAAAFNRRLSQARAAALRDYLKSQGVAVRFELRGRGADEPYSPDGGQSFTQEELYQLDRRVELIR